MIGGMTYEMIRTRVQVDRLAQSSALDFTRVKELWVGTQIGPDYRSGRLGFCALLSLAALHDVAIPDRAPARATHNSASSAGPR
jgi:hypothetical protein